jgi:hypothetical protein
MDPFTHGAYKEAYTEDEDFKDVISRYRAKFI